MLSWVKAGSDYDDNADQRVQTEQMLEPMNITLQFAFSSPVANLCNAIFTIQSPCWLIFTNYRFI